MEKLIDLIMSHGQEKLDQLQIEVNKVQENLSKNKDKPQLESVLPMLSAETNTLGMIHILYEF